MAEHNPFEIDQAWELVEVTSPRGEKQVYKINGVSKQVYFKTAPGDGNSADWRGCNVSFDAIKQQNHRVIEAESLKERGAGSPTKPPEIVVEHKKAKPIDLESVAPGAKKRME